MSRVQLRDVMDGQNPMQKQGSDSARTPGRSGMMVRSFACSPGLPSRVLTASLCLLFLGSTAQAQQTDAVSREFTVFNNLSNPVVIRDAVSREFSVFNGVAAPPVVIVDVVSREFTTYNDLTNPVALVDTVTREFSVLNTIHCTGNLTDDGLVTIADIPTFVDVLRGVLTDPIRRDAADVNCDGQADGLDISPFVNRLLFP